MKKLISLIISLTLIAAFAAFPVEAKILHQCHCCDGDGIYTCDAVDCRDGKLPCGRCNSTGEAEEKCGECNGTGKCRICQGTGKRSGDGTIDCDNCKGTGQCQGGPGWGACTQGYYYSTCPDCNGEGTIWHDSEWCVYARNHNGQCPICKGTGYEGDGVEGTPNNGVSNVPRAGDGIYYLDGSYAIYGGGSSGGGRTGTGAGTGAGISTEPPQQNDPSSTEPGTESQEQSGTDTPQADMTLVPDNRNSDFEIPIPADSDRPATASVYVETGKMTDEEQRYYAALPEEELAQILTNVRTIVASAEPGRSDSDTDDLLYALAAQNGYESAEDGRIFPLYFEGHQEIGFPVRVTVSIEKGVLDGGTDLFAYHVADDGTVEPLGPAEYATYEDGSIESVSFYTTAFSTFFTAAKELDLAVQADASAPDAADEKESKPGNKTPIVPIVAGAIAAVVLAALVIAVILLVKKRKNPGANR